MPDTTFPGIGHVALTVSDLQRSVAWYRQLFDAEPVLNEDTGPYHHVVWMLGGTLLGLHQHSRATSSDPVDELRPGLDHVAFACADRAELEVWAKRLDALDITRGRQPSCHRIGASFPDFVTRPGVRRG